ncbi:relaxase/mobilization nuclease domain-containing protein [Jannaschia aquimarina]|uniref:Relaxase/mobilization nuclease domain protein n=1 Tax=Jannaschia aquimarina TaxID=935700 RepID=A0A0D1EHM8_9RHOB|nr:relaxase/mobilization nuclease domain-containing protein [Jannaschia aquimarina]KIT16366.1 Relaxase/mobilization nuclease domain protein [Jannaschia aquimarina]SNT04911.1 Relaxase/Mobilisation nuclease domain-containing protein [Jannaschia aquimarina]
MILKAKERGDAPQLARYLLDQRDNEHVELPEVRGFISDDLIDAFGEAHAIAQGTRCENYMFSMSFNPPEGAHASIEAFEKAIDQVEEKLGLQGQPRAVIFHEKNGRRHAHAVWSRIDSERMRSINISHYKVKLRDVSRQLFLEHGWTMPRGLEDQRLRDPLSFTRTEWQQAKRIALDPKELKAVFRKAWESSDSRAAFEQALAERGFVLAQGDRRAFVAVDYRGEVYGIARKTGVKVKEVAAKLGDPSELPCVDTVKAEIAARMTGKIREFIEQAEKDAQRRSAFIDFRKAEVVGRHVEERRASGEAQEKRWQAETLARAARLPKGMVGIWHRLTGRYAKVKALNERETLEALRRDRDEKDALIMRQLEERQALEREIRAQRDAAQEELLQLREDVASYMELDRIDHTQSRKIERDGDGDDGPRPRPPRTRRRRGYEP